MNLSKNSFEEPAGSPDPGEPVFLVVGKIRRTHGVRGELLMDVLTDFPERLRQGLTVYVGEKHLPMLLRRCRSHGSGLLVTFDEYSDPEAAGALRNEFIYVRAEDIPKLPEGDYYHHQILGLRVVNKEGASLGRVINILETGANDVCVIRQDSGAEFLLPFMDSTVLEINLAQGFMRVHVLDGLI